MTDRDVVRRGYDGMADTYADARSPGPLESEALDALLGSLPDDARLLDVGCGGGRPVLERVGAGGVGVDLSRGQLRRAAENAPGAGLVEGEMTALPFEEDAFDAACALHSIIHVPVEDGPAVFRELARVLRPGGRLLVTTGHGEWRGSNPDWLDTGTEMRWSIAGPARTGESLTAAGFTVRDRGELEDGLAQEDDAGFVWFVAELDGERHPER